MTVRAKFQLHSITEYASGTGKTFKFVPNYDESIPEDRRFYKYSPSGELTILVDNPAVFEQWKIGDFYYLDFTRIENPKPAGDAS